MGPDDMLTKRGLAEAREEISTYGAKPLRRFDHWAAMFQEQEDA